MNSWVRKTFKIFSYIALIYIGLVILEYARQGFINDLSLQPISEETTPDLGTTSPSKRPPVYLISYADGKFYYFQNQNAFAASALNKGIDFILNYRKSHIDLNFYNKNKDIFSVKQGGGMYLWKPYILSKTLETTPEGAIVIYMDAAFTIQKPLTPLLKPLDKHDVILMRDHERTNGGYVKGDTFALTNCKDEGCRRAPLIASGFIAVKNTAASRRFMKEWLNYCQDIRILRSTNTGIQPNYPEFKWHHFEQSVLSMVNYKHQNFAALVDFHEVLSYADWFHRRPGKSSPYKGWFTVYGIKPWFYHNPNGKTLSSISLLNFPPLVHLRKWFIETFMTHKTTR